MKKSQVNMTESIGILIVFFFLIVIGFTFYTKFQQASFEQEQRKIIMQKGVGIAQIVSNLPEIKCSWGTETEVVEKGACIDLLKLSSAKDIFESNHGYYYDLLSYTRITVEVIYPSPPPSTLSTVYGFSGTSSEFYSHIPTEYLPETGTYKEKYSSKTKTFFPVLLKDPLEQKFYFGVLTVDVYTR